MNLGFARLQSDSSSTAQPVSFAVLMVGVAARQAASPTARLAMRLDRPASAMASLFGRQGAFSPATALALSNWQRP